MLQEKSYNINKYMYKYYNLPFLVSKCVPSAWFCPISLMSSPVQLLPFSTYSQYPEVVAPLENGIHVNMSIKLPEFCANKSRIGVMFDSTGQVFRLHEHH